MRNLNYYFDILILIFYLMLFEMLNCCSDFFTVVFAFELVFCALCKHVPLSHGNY